MNWGLYANEAQVISVVVAFIASGYGVYRTMDKKQTRLETDLSLISQKLEFIVQQFGPNGGGLRQAVNEMSDRLYKMDERQIEIGDKVAELDGRFSQHLAESNK